jgi:hypothetical protein
MRSHADHNCRRRRCIGHLLTVEGNDNIVLEGR